MEGQISHRLHVESLKDYILFMLVIMFLEDRAVDEQFILSCPLGCNKTHPQKTNCIGSSSCFYKYSGSFCEIKELSNGQYSSGITICHKNGIQNHYTCQNTCQQLTESFAKCIPSKECSTIQTTSQTFGYCPTPSYPISNDIKYNLNLYDDLARELQNELSLQSPYCSFIGYLTSCSIIFQECHNK